MAKRGGDTVKDELPKAKLSIKNLKKSLRLFSYVKNQKWLLVAAFFFLIGTSVVGLIFPVLSGKLLSYFGETGMSQEKMDGQIKQIGLILLGILILQAFFSFGRVAVFSRITENILKEIGRAHV